MKNSIKHKALLITFILATIGTFSSCKTNSAVNSEKQAQNKVILDSLYAQTSYRVDIEVVYPQNTVATTQVANALLRNTGDNAARIDVRGDGNFIEIKNDSIIGYMPFFGESRISGGDYGGRNIAIEFEEAVKNLDKEIDQKKGKLILKFRANQKVGDNDKYDITVNIFPRGNASVEVNPTYRTFIRYDGVLVEPKE